MKKQDKKRVKKAAKSAVKAAKKRPILVAVVLIIIILALLVGAYWYFFLRKDPATPPLGEGDNPPKVEDQTPSGGENQTPSVGENQTPSVGENQTPSGGENQTPSGGENQTPSGGGNQTPSGGENQTPSGGENQTPSQPTGELTIHFLELGNKYAGDCVLIKIGDTEVLIDGGSREASADTIESYVKQYCTDGILEYVIVTHADQDHIAAFAGNGTHKSLFERFECQVIIDFPRTNKTTATYNRYVAARDAEVKAGAVHYTALQCYQETDGAQRSYTLAEGVTMNFLYNYYYENKSSDENNYSVCMYIAQGEYNYLFTGDLEEDGERRLVENNDLPKCKLFKGGHHGSNTSSTEALLSVIQPEYVCICCCAGAPEYTTNLDNVFPTKNMLERVLKYTDKIFVTSLATDVVIDPAKKTGTWNYTSFNGNILVRSDGKEFSVTGSNSSESIIYSEWYKENRAS